MATKLAIITGGSTGLGYALALQLAKRQPDWTIVISSRNAPSDALPANIAHHPLDCSSLKDVRRFAKEVEEAYPKANIHALVLNAGIQIVQGRQQSVDGYEMTFATNHVGQALLFFLLQHRLAPSCRIGLTSSGTHDPAQKTGLPAPDYQSAKECAQDERNDAKTAMHDGQQRYSRSKLVNIMWALALRTRIKQAGLHYTVAAFDPGLMPGTGLGRGFPGPLKLLWTHVLPYMLPLLRLVMFPNIHTTTNSAANYVELLLDARLPADDTSDDVYWDYSGALKAYHEAYDVEKQADLWQWTVDKVAQDAKERAAFAALKV